MVFMEEDFKIFCGGNCSFGSGFGKCITGALSGFPGTYETAVMSPAVTCACAAMIGHSEADTAAFRLDGDVTCLHLRWRPALCFYSSRICL
jgi:hypothetical protein